MKKNGNDFSNSENPKEDYDHREKIPENGNEMEDVTFEQAQEESQLSEMNEIDSIKFDNDILIKDTEEYKEKVRKKLRFFVAFFCPSSQMVQIAINELKIDSSLLEFNGTLKYLRIFIYFVIEGLRIIDKLYEAHPEVKETGKKYFFILQYTKDKERIPLLKHQDQLVEGAISIIEYLDDNFGKDKSLHCQNINDVELQASSYAAQYRIFRYLAPPFYRMLMRQNKEGQEGEMKEFLKCVKDLLNFYIGPFYIGEQFSIADITIAPYFNRMNFEVPQTPEYEKWHDWQKNVLNRETVKSTIQEAKQLQNTYKRFAENTFRTNWWLRTFGLEDL